MTDEDIADALNESEFDYSGDDLDCDPTFKPLELDRGVIANDSDMDSTGSDDSDNSPELDHPTPSATLSTDSRAPRSRGRAQSRRPSRSRGSCSRGRGRSLTNPRVITLRGNTENDHETLDKWSAEAFEPEERCLMQPAYLAIDSTGWEWLLLYFIKNIRKNWIFMARIFFTIFLEILMP